MCAIDQSLDAHGVEAIRGGNVDQYSGDIVATYVNTIIHDNMADRYLLMSWGDFLERFKVKYEIT
ncbi:MAG: hypothetical protein H0X04_00385 [Chthoniobacterales bacterium]|nr:hypothetical protein [Chthoniobacterales bacterium]